MLETKVAPAQDMGLTLATPLLAIPSPSELQQRLGEHALKVLQDIVDDTQRRKQGYLKHHALLNGGIFYAEEYFQMLQTAQEDCKKRKIPSPAINDRIKDMIERGIFYHGMAPVTFFTQEPDKHAPTFLRRNTFKIKADELPSRAIEKVVGPEKGLTLVGCTQVFQLVFAKVLLDHIGADKFDKIFSEKGVKPLSIGPDAQDYALMNLISCIRTPSKEHGDWICFKGYDTYTFKHLFGIGDGENVLVKKTADDQPLLYREFGSSKAGQLKEEIDQQFVAEYNKQQLSFKKILAPAFSARIWRGVASPVIYRRFAKSQITLAQFHLANSGGIIFHGRFHAKRIHELMSAPTPEAASELMERFEKD